ncbi:hypothetical protein LXL04_039361 [Taraxacum kok-saghyz]
MRKSSLFSWDVESSRLEMEIESRGQDRHRMHVGRNENRRRERREVDRNFIDVVGGRELVGDVNPSLGSSFCRIFIFPWSFLCNTFTDGTEIPPQPSSSGAPVTGNNVGGGGGK